MFFIEFVCEELIMDNKEKSKEYIRLSFVSGLISGAINKFLTHPIDTLKARIQVNQLHYSSIENVKRSGIMDTGRNMYKVEGIRGFYRGVGIACVR